MDKNDIIRAELQKIYSDLRDGKELNGIWRVRTKMVIESILGCQDFSNQETPDSSSEKAIRSDIENIIARSADGTFLNGLKDAWWIEYGEPGPQECADELFEYVIKLLGEAK